MGEHDLVAVHRLPAFPTELIAAKGTKDAITVALYLGTMFVTTCTMFAMDWIVRHYPQLQAPSTPAPSLVPGAVRAAVLGAALILGTTVRAIGLFALLLLLLEGPLTKLLSRRDHPAG